MIFINAQVAFERFYLCLSEGGIDFDNTKALLNVGFKILKPLDNKIETP